MMDVNKIQRVELNKFYDISIFCPFCGQCVLDMEPEAESSVNACPHTLFVAHDEGFEYRSSHFDEHMGLSGVGDFDIEVPETGIDGLTDQVALVDAIKVASYAGPPGGMGLYVGFSPEFFISGK